MNQDQIHSILQDLSNRNIEEVLIKKEDFLIFRAELVKREDFKHFRGIAQHGGDIIYTYLDEPRS
jgi:predicted kinase